MRLNKSYRIRLSEEDLLLLNSLKKLRIKPTTFVRIAIREKLKRDLPSLLNEEEKRIKRIKLPF